MGNCNELIISLMMDSTTRVLPMTFVHVSSVNVLSNFRRAKISLFPPLTSHETIENDYAFIRLFFSFFFLLCACVLVLITFLLDYCCFLRPPHNSPTLIPKDRRKPSRIIESRRCKRPVFTRPIAVLVTHRLLSLLKIPANATSRYLYTSVQLLSDRKHAATAETYALYYLLFFL